MKLKGKKVIILGERDGIQGPAIAACVHAGLCAAGLPEAAVQVIEVTDRAAVGELITMKDYVDIVVPRGGPGPGQTRRVDFLKVSKRRELDISIVAAAFWIARKSNVPKTE